MYLCGKAIHVSRREGKAFKQVVGTPTMRHQCEDSAAQSLMAEYDRAYIRFGIVPQRELKGLEKMWTRYREQNQLDLYGKQQGPAAGNLTCA